MKRGSSMSPTSTKNIKISSIRPKDKLIFEKSIIKLKPNSYNYEDSWGYIIQSTRYQGFKCYDSKTGSLIFFGNKSSKDNTPVITNTISSVNYIKKSIKEIQKITNNTKVIIKNIDKKDVNTYLKQGFREYTNKERWDKTTKYDDQTYPQILVNIEKLLNKYGTQYQHLRTALHKDNDLYIRKYLKTDKKDVLKIFSIRDSQTPKHKKNMYFESHSMFPDSKINNYVICTKSNNEIVGFTATSKINDNTFSLVAAIFKIKDNHTSIIGTFLTILEEYKNNYKYVNLGGSESKLMYQFKKEKFIPCKEISKIHLIYDNKIK